MRNQTNINDYYLYFTKMQQLIIQIPLLDKTQLFTNPGKTQVLTNKDWRYTMLQLISLPYFSQALILNIMLHPEV